MKMNLTKNSKIEIIIKERIDFHKDQMNRGYGGYTVIKELELILDKINQVQRDRKINTDYSYIKYIN